MLSSVCLAILRKEVLTAEQECSAAGDEPASMSEGTAGKKQSLLLRDLPGG